MLIDIACILFFLAMAWSGYLTGGFSQIVKITSLIGGYVLARLLGGNVAQVFEHSFHLPSTLAYILASTILILGGAWLLALILKTYFKPLINQHTQNTNNYIGAILGGVKGGLIAYIVLCLLATFTHTLSEKVSPKLLPVKESKLVSFVSSRNYLTEHLIPVLGKLKDLAIVSNQQRSNLPEETQEILEDPAVGGLMQDPLLGGALQTGDWNYVLNDPKIQQLFKNPKSLQKVLESSINMRQKLLDGIEQ